MANARIEELVAQASERLPAVVYSFNIADLKRRNGHLGHGVGDLDIQELNRLLQALGPSALVARTHGDRWLVLVPETARDDISLLLERFARSEPFLAGWEMRATKDGRRMVSRETEPASIMRAVRCLFAPVRTRAELEDAILRIEDNDYALPVDRPIALADVASIERKPWQCVSRYPEARPACPFCGGRDTDWHDGDGSVYSGDGTCKGCGARLELRDVTAPVPFQRNELFEDLGFRRIVPVAHYRIAIAEEGGRRQLVSLLRHHLPAGHAALDERPPWDLPLVGLRSAWSSEEAPSVLVELLPRGMPSTEAEAEVSALVPPFVVSLAAQLVEAHAAGRVVGELHPALVFVDDDDELVACAQRPLRAESAQPTASGAETTSTRCGMAPMFFDRCLTPRQARGDPRADDASDDVFRFASMVWRWRHRASPFGADHLAQLMNVINGTPVEAGADDLDRLLLRALVVDARERPSALRILDALRALGSGWRLV